MPPDTNLAGPAIENGRYLQAQDSQARMGHAPVWDGVACHDQRIQGMRTTRAVTGQSSSTQGIIPWSAGLDQTHQSIQFIPESSGDDRRLYTRNDGKSHDDDAAAAGPGHRSYVGASLAARGNLAQIVNGACGLVCGDPEAELLIALCSEPARLIASPDRIGKGRRPVWDAGCIDQQRHYRFRIGITLDALRLGASSHKCDGSSTPVAPLIVENTLYHPQTWAYGPMSGKRLSLEGGGDRWRPGHPASFFVGDS